MGGGEKYNQPSAAVDEGDEAPGDESRTKIARKRWRALAVFGGPRRRAVSGFT
jgi:hypothetical protein